MVAARTSSGFFVEHRTVFQEKTGKWVYEIEVKSGPHWVEAEVSPIGFETEEEAYTAGRLRVKEKHEELSNRGRHVLSGMRGHN